MAKTLRKYKEYAEENGKVVNTDNLKADFLEKGIYKLAHRGLVLACHDVFINYRGKMLLVHRDNFPAKDDLWPIGGRLLRGIPTENSLREKTYQECNLFLEEIKFLGVNRTFFETSPYDSEEKDNRGTDGLSVVYYAKGSGKIKLDKLHKRPLLLGIEDYLKIRPKLHPYVTEYLDFLCSNGKDSFNPEKISSRNWGEGL